MKNLKTANLFYQEGSSNKEYHLQIVEENGGYSVLFQFGRVGNALQSGSKTSLPVSLEDAEKIFKKFFLEKTRKGYVENETSGSGYSVVDQTTKKIVVMAPQLLNPIDDAQQYIDDDSYLAQPKKDGIRFILENTLSTHKAYNKKGTEIPVPHSIAESNVNAAIILDGELIGETLWVFDFLLYGNSSLKDEKCEIRVKELDTLTFGDNIKVVPTAYTRKEKQEMYNVLLATNQEGIVFKKKDAKYSVGRPNSGGPALKFKFQNTGTFIVSNHTSGKRSVGLEVVDGEKRVSVGKITIPSTHQIPKVGSFIEAQYLYAYKGGAIFQSVYLKDRSDECDETDCSISQLVYKPE